MCAKFKKMSAILYILCAFLYSVCKMCAVLCTMCAVFFVLCAISNYLSYNNLQNCVQSCAVVCNHFIARARAYSDALFSATF